MKIFEAFFNTLHFRTVFIYKSIKNQILTFMIGTMLTVTVASLLNQLVIAVPAIILASSTLTSALQGVFNIKEGKLAHILSWVIGVLTGVCFVAFNGLTFGAPVWLDYVLGGVSGLLGAAASNGLYTRAATAITAAKSNVAAVPLPTT